MAAIPGDEIVLSKWTGLKGTAEIAGKRTREIGDYFSPYFLETVLGFKQYFSVETEERIAREYGASYIKETGECGIYGALWEMAESSGVGITVYLRDIPIRQETVEIANLLDFDPYLLLSGGSLLFTVKSSYGLIRALKDEGINAQVIGTVNDSNDRVVINNGIRRFLSPRSTDPFESIMGKESPGDNR